MSEREKSVSIAGAGTIAGGTYDHVTIAGAGKVTGDVVAQEIRIAGAGRIEGRAEAREIVTAGSAAFGGDLIADEMKVSGQARVEGHVKVKELKCSGSLRAERGISGEYIKVSGQLRAGGDVESEIFKASGGFEIEGLLSADKMEIEIAGPCRAREIGGETISVRRAGWREKGLLDGLVRIRILIGRGAPELSATQIEGDDVTLEDTIADVVRGKRIEIGPGSRIGRVEYAESLRVHQDAEVREKAKV